MPSLLILLLIFFVFLFGDHLSNASDSISPDKSLSGNQTIVSSNGKFVLGFFTPGNSHNYYVGIWYGRIPVQTVIWVANREVPLSSSYSSELRISQDGNLILLNHSKAPIWSTNITSPALNSTMAVLLDTGNLVLRSSLDSPIPHWQSFDHPTDTWVPGAWVGMNKLTGEFQNLTSWKSLEDPAPGLFTHGIDPSGLGDYLCLWNQSVVYDHLGAWNGQSFDLVPQVTLSSYFKVGYVETKERKYINGSVSNDSILVRMVLDVTGQLKILVWKNDEHEWLLFWSRPVEQCDVYSVCGAFGVCDVKGMPACGCLHGFEPRSMRSWKLDDWSGGCVRKSHLQCEGNASLATRQADVFYEMHAVRFPTSSWNLSVANAEECKLECFNSCNCTTYAYDRGGACLMWNGQLYNLQQLLDSDGSGGTLYLRLAASELPRKSGGKRKFSSGVAILCFILGFLSITSIALMAIYRYQRRASADMAKVMDGSLLQFKYSDLHRITKKFSVMLGKGGFGSVFAGVLSDSTLVAVKKLEGLGQGEKQFRTEVRTLGTIQHVNLVRLRGFCCERDKLLLVYDYMPNGSLDKHLFRKEPPCLDWAARYQIALGTARGLAYLHEKCRECIIHCDIKPENILLDESLRPKVADFGMAKLIARDFRRVLTTVRGTIGYLAPEWVSGLAITPKADVYSFGMMLFELISGRRNADMRRGGDGSVAIGYFPLLVAYAIHEGGDVLQLLDHRLSGDADTEELTRACKAACWCTQDEESCRPTMGQAVLYLEGALLVGVPPLRMSLMNMFGSGDYSAFM